MDALYTNLDDALNAYRDDVGFEVLASALILQAHPDLEPMGGTGDGGRDAVLKEALFRGEATRFQYSVQKDWKKKVRTELSRYAGSGSVKHIVFLFKVPIKQSEADKLREDAQRLGIAIEIWGREWLAARLQNRPDLAERFLNMAPRPPPDLLDPLEYARRLAQRIPGFHARVVADAENSVEAIREALSRPNTRALLIVGGGGTGKTRLALEALPPSIPALVLPPSCRAGKEIARELPAQRDVLLLVDDAHSRDNLAELQSILHEPKWNGLRLVLTVRPGYSERVRGALGLPDDATAELRFRPLRRPQIDALLQNEPHCIGDASVRLRLIKIAQGNPLVAHLAATALRSRPLDVETASEILIEYSKVGKLTSRDRLLVAAVALAGNLHPGKDQEFLALAVPRESHAASLQVLARLADEGLLTEGESGYTIKPDLLCPAIVANVLLPSGKPSPVNVRGLADWVLANRPAGFVDRFAHAVLTAQGRGADILREIVRDTWPGPLEVSGSAWTRALDLAEAYGPALPGDCATLVQQFIAWSSSDSAKKDAADLSVATQKASAVAKGVAFFDADLGVRVLVSLLANGPDLGLDAEKSPARKALREMCRTAATFEAPTVGRRQMKLLGALRGWHGEQLAEGNVSARQWGALSLSCVELMRVHFEFTEEAPQSANQFRIGALVASLSPELLEAVDGAARLAAEGVPRSEEAALSAMLDRLTEIDNLARHGYVISNLNLPGEARAVLARAVDLVLAAFIDSWKQLPALIRFRLGRLSSGRQRLRAVVRRDGEVRDLGAVFPEVEHYSKLERWSRVMEARAERFADQNPGLAGAKRLEEILAQGASLRSSRLGGGYIGKALTRRANQEEAKALVFRFVESPMLRAYASGVSAEVMANSHPAFDELPMQALGVPGGGEAVLPMLAHLDRRTATRLLGRILRDGCTNLLRVAEHVGHRVPLAARAKYSLLACIAERVAVGERADVLAVIGQVAHGSKERPSTKAGRKVVAQTRAAIVARDDRLGQTPWLEPLFKAVGTWNADDLIELVGAFTERLVETAAIGRRCTLWSMLEAEVRSALGALTPDRRRDLADRLADWLWGAYQHRWRSEALLFSLLRILAGPGMEPGVIWARQATTRLLAVESIRGKCPSGEWEEVARALLAEPLTRSEEDALLASAGLGDITEGPLSEHFRRRLRFFEGWAQDPDARVRLFGERAASEYQKHTEREQLRELAEEENA